MARKLSLIGSLIVIVFVFISACRAPAPEYQSAPSVGAYLQPNFSAYREQTRDWLKQHRHFLTADRTLELRYNSPFELSPTTATQPPKKGVLLVHGLGDSPYSFIDIAQSLADQGYLVRSLLLPGHGSKPGDLTLPTLEDWHALVRHHRQLMAQEVDELWLGGFSTGANLVTIDALNHPDESAGLLLFSPAFKPRHPLVRFAPLLNYIVDWADQEEETNAARYDSLAMNGVAQYQRSATEVCALLTEKHYAKPVFVVLSEADNVVDTELALRIFEEDFTHPGSHLIWHGEQPLELSRSTRFSSRLPEQRISTASHMSPLFSPDNPYYGVNGTQRICGNGHFEEDRQRCLNGEPVWFSAWGYREKGKVHARLTWNPYYTQSEQIMLDVMQSERANTPIASH